jgi:CheY-like chemotaxis protein
LPHDPGLVRLVDNAMEGARRGKSLTTRMLAFARKQDLKSERIDLARLVNGMAELMERALGPTISVEVRIGPQLSAVQTDAGQLEAALLNLAINARDAMQGTGSIVIAAEDHRVEAGHPKLAPGQYVCLSVCDAGEGMDEETLKRATEPFFTTKGVGKGTGLGLSMVHGIAEQSGGTLLLKSSPGAGTSAEIWLPAADAAPEKVPEAPRTSPARSAEPLTILAVDDDPLILMNMADMLEDLGHSVMSAGSGRQALDLLKTRNFDLLITDHAMPHMTGAQLISEARERCPAMAVILATGYAELPRDGSISVPRLAKPFSQADLAEAVSNVAAMRTVA